MMKKVFLFIGCIVFTAFMSPTHAQFGGMLGGMLGGGGGGDIDGRVKSFVDGSNQLKNLVVNSLSAINAAYASDSDAAQIRAKADAYAKATDPKEKAALAAEIVKTESAKLEELSKSADAVEKTKKLDTTKRKQVMDSLVNFGIGALQAITLTDTGKSIVSSVGSNPMNITKVAPVTDALPILADAISISTKVFPGYYKVLRGANIEPPKVTAETKPVADLKF